MTGKEVCRYLELMDRRVFILTHSGASWKPEYGPELEVIDKELVRLRKSIDQVYEQKEKGEKGACLPPQFIGVKEVKEILRVSESKAYSVIRQLNHELKAKGFIIVPGKVSRRFFFEKCYCDETEEK